MAKKRKKHLSKDPIKQEILNITRPPSTRRSIPSSDIIKNAVRKIDSLRFKYNYQNLNKIYDGLPKIYKDNIYNRNIAKSLKDVGSGEFGFEATEDKFEQQLNWFTLISLNHSDEINKFLKQKQEFEYKFLHANYEDAEDIVNNTSTDISYSFWGILSKWLLKEYAYSVEEKIEYLSELGNEDTDSVIYHLFAIYFSRIVESDISIQRYLDKINLDIYHNYDIEDKQIRYFIESYLNPNQVFFFDSSIGIFFGDEESSIIDIYINMQKIILNNVLFKNMDMSVVINRLLEKIKDEKLENIKLLILNDDINLNLEPSQKASMYFELLDNFTSEKYDISLNMSKSFLEIYPASLDICEIYVKSHIYSNLPLESIGISDSILNIILKNIHDILLQNDKTASAIVELNNLSFNLSSFDISKQLTLFIKKYTEQNAIHLYDKVSKIFADNLTPNFIDILTVNKKSYLKSLKNISNMNTLTINLFEKLLDYEDRQFK